MPWYDSRRKEPENRALIKSQAYGEAFDPNKLDRVARYESLSFPKTSSEWIKPICLLDYASVWRDRGQDKSIIRDRRHAEVVRADRHQIGALGGAGRATCWHRPWQGAKDRI